MIVLQGFWPLQNIQISRFAKSGSTWSSMNTECTCFCKCYCVGQQEFWPSQNLQISRITKSRSTQASMSTECIVSANVVLVSKKSIPVVFCVHSNYPKLKNILFYVHTSAVNVLFCIIDQLICQLFKYSFHSPKCYTLQCSYSNLRFKDNDIL